MSEQLDGAPECVVRDGVSSRRPHPLHGPVATLAEKQLKAVRIVQSMAWHCSSTRRLPEGAAATTPRAFWRCSSRLRPRGPDSARHYSPAEQ